MSNKTYDTLKYTVSIALPALATFYTALSGIWGLPFGDQVPGTISAIVALGSSLLCISSNKYNRGGDE